eukprot:4715250-Amphidinium_carterae.1
MPEDDIPASKQKRTLPTSTESAAARTTEQEQRGARDGENATEWPVRLVQDVSTAVPDMWHQQEALVADAAAHLFLRQARQHFVTSCWAKVRKTECYAL